MLFKKICECPALQVLHHDVAVVAAFFGQSFRIINSSSRDHVHNSDDVIVLTNLDHLSCFAQRVVAVVDSL